MRNAGPFALLFSILCGGCVPLALGTDLGDAGPPGTGHAGEAGSDGGLAGLDAAALDAAEAAAPRDADGDTGAPAHDSGAAGAGDAAAEASVVQRHALFFASTAPQYVSAPDAPALRPAAALTLEAWIDDTGSLPNDVGLIVGKAVGSGTVDSYALWRQGAYLCGGVSVASPQDALCAPWLVSDLTWAHVAFTHDAQGAEGLFVDGRAIATRQATTVPSYDAHALTIGSDDDGGHMTDGFVGRIDDVRVYGVARSPAQIAADRAGAAPGAGVVASYPFDEGTGTIAHDVAGGHDAAFAGDVEAPAWTTEHDAPPAGP